MDGLWLWCVLELHGVSTRNVMFSDTLWGVRKVFLFCGDGCDCVIRWIHPNWNVRFWQLCLPADHSMCSALWTARNLESIFTSTLPIETFGWILRQVLADLWLPTSCFREGACNIQKLRRVFSDLFGQPPWTGQVLHPPAVRKWRYPSQRTLQVTRRKRLLEGKLTYLFHAFSCFFLG